MAYNPHYKAGVRITPRMKRADRRRKNLKRLQEKRKEEKSRTVRHKKLSEYIKRNKKIIELRERPFLPLNVAYEITDILQEKLPNCTIYPSAGLRRRLPRIIYLVYVVTGEITPKDIRRALLTEGILISDVTPRSSGRTRRGADFVLFYRGVPMFIHKTTKRQVEPALLFTTGNDKLYRVLCSIAIKNGMRLKKTGLYQNEECIAETEKDIFWMLGVRYVPPVERGFDYKKNLYFYTR